MIQVRCACDIDVPQQRLLPKRAIEPFFPIFIRPGRASEGKWTIDKNAVLDHIVMSSMRKHCPKFASGGLVKHVAKYGLTAGAIVEIDCATAMSTGAADMMPKIITQDRTALRGISAHVKCATIIGLDAGVMNLIEFDHMVISAQADGLMRAVVQQIMRQPNANPTNMNVVSVSPLPAGYMMNMIVNGLMSAGLEGFA